MKRLQAAGAAHAHDPCLAGRPIAATSGSSARIRTRSGRAPHRAAHDPCSASGETAAAGRRKRRNRPPRPTGSLLAGPAHAHETGLESGRARSFERERGLHRRRGRRSARIRTCRPTWPMSQRRRSETAPDLARGLPPSHRRSSGRWRAPAGAGACPTSPGDLASLDVNGRRGPAVAAGTPSDSGGALQAGPIRVCWSHG